MRRINHLDEALFGAGEVVPAGTLVEFLVWAYSDLCDDVIKGIFAEWLVAKILGINTRRRYEWANSDLVSERGTKIEVKASSYWQSWKAINPDGSPKDLAAYPIQPDTKIRFGGLAAKDTINHHRESVGVFKSEVYVFCFQNEKNYEQWNAMDLGQWEFYFVRVDNLPSKSVSLHWLRANHFGPLSPKMLVERFSEYELGAAAYNHSR